tara:strand:- start:12595 stop:13800 length:1206 start_codon:yes stop_codon:yes gene_type:complete
MAKRRIVLGVSGGIAAYKTPQLVRDLIERGAEVRVVLTKSAQAFVTPLSLQTVSEHPVATDLLDAHQESTMGHIDLARWADTVLIAPATANTIAQLAHGHANDLLTTLCLATRAPIRIAPAMNTQMWQHPLTQKNIETLQKIGIKVLAPDSGTLACGETGPGRMMDTTRIATSCLTNHHSTRLDNIHIMITAGPTQEAIDPVRYLTNHSSGKMGYALTQAAQQLGATVTLISGPTAIPTPSGVNTIQVTSALEMQQAVQQHLSSCDIFIGTAAVCDYRIDTITKHKIKKDQGEFKPQFVRTPDIIAEVAHQTPKPFVVGFAAETQHVIENAKKKCKVKQLDMMIANDVSQGKVFDKSESAVTVIHCDGTSTHYHQEKKESLAFKLLNDISKNYHKRLVVHP